MYTCRFKSRKEGRGRAKVIGKKKTFGQTALIFGGGGVGGGGVLRGTKKVRESCFSQTKNRIYCRNVTRGTAKTGWRESREGERKLHLAKKREGLEWNRAFIVGEEKKKENEERAKNKTRQL